MRLICPHCMSSVTVSDDTAGKETTCPACGKSFPTPARYTATVMPDTAASAAGPLEPVRSTPHPEPPSQPPPPPGVVTPPASQADHTGFLVPAQRTVPQMEGYTRSCGVTISLPVLAWLPVILLLLTFILTMFPWVGSYAGNTAVYSQRPWGAMFGRVKRDFTLEKLVPIPSDWLAKVESDWLLMLPFLLLLILAVLMALAERGLQALAPQRFPLVQKVWPYRQTVILALAALALVLIIVQVSRGFGMERAIRQYISEKFADDRAKYANSLPDLDRLDYEMDQEYAKYKLEYTTWSCLALTFLSLAVLAAIGRFILERRGNKPPPRLVLHY